MFLHKRKKEEEEKEEEEEEEEEEGRKEILREIDFMGPTFLFFR